MPGLLFIPVFFFGAAIRLMAISFFDRSGVPSLASCERIASSAVYLRLRRPD